MVGTNLRQKFAHAHTFGGDFELKIANSCHTSVNAWQKVDMTIILVDEDLVSINRTVASSLEVVRPYCIVLTTTPTFTHSLVQVPHKCGMAMAVPAL